MRFLTRFRLFGQQMLLRAPRGMWLLTATVILVFLFMQRVDLFIPIPFLLLILTVALSGATSGMVSGAISGLLMSAFILYSWRIGFGPVPLTGTLIRALMGCTVSIGLGVYLGAVRDQLATTFGELEAKRDELDLLNRDLATRVAERTTELESARDRLQRNQDKLRRITKHWVDTQETERRNLARELHDDIGQSMTALRISLDSCRRRLAADPQTHKRLDTSIKLADDAIDSVRQLSLNLRPSLLDDLGLIAAIREHTSRQLGIADISLDLVHDGDDRGIGATTKITAFRLVQEAVSNILQHADATHVDVRIRIEPQTLLLDIEDDGKGFVTDSKPIESRHFGLASMRERADMMGGDVDVVSRPGAGTMVHVSLPLVQGRAAI